MNEFDLKQLNFIGENDSFSFGCTCCGACCRHREDILLSAYDLWRIAGYLHKSIEEIVDVYCRVYIGNSSHLPVVNIEPKGMHATCPFLIRNKCTIHIVKPQVCAIFPLGRISTEDTGETKYFLQSIDCGDKTQTYTLKKWLAKSGITEDSHECLSHWGKLLNSFFEVAKIINDFSDTGKKACYNAIFSAMYLGYVIEKPFLPQIKERQKTMADLSKKLCEMAKYRTDS